jgi:signal transduction histidine kinase
LRETNPEILVKLLAATERALFERLLELAANKDASDEQQDIRLAIDVMLTLKARTNQAGSEGSSVKEPGVGHSRAQDRVTALGGTFEILSEGAGTTVKVAVPLQVNVRDRASAAHA